MKWLPNVSKFENEQYKNGIASKEFSLVMGYSGDIVQVMEDGDHIRLGNTDITCVLSPGHTCGTMTFFFDAVEDGKPLRVGYLGGAGLLTVYKDFCKKFDLPLNKSQMLRNTLHMLKGYHMDIMLGNHPSQNRTLEKRQWMLDHPGENDFLDPSAWPEFLAAQLTRLDDFDAKGY